MHCVSCGIESNKLRPYVQVSATNGAIVHLCAACRVFNTLHPRYVAYIDAADDSIAAPPPAPARGALRRDAAGAR